MQEFKFYKIKHLGDLCGKPFWFDSNPKYYGIDKDNFFFALDDAKEVLKAIIDKSGNPADEYRITYNVHTEEVVA